MAESIVAFAVAANVINFIDFSCKILSHGYRTYTTGLSTVQEYQDLDVITADLSRVTSDLDATLQREKLKQSCSPNDIQLQRLAVQCRGVCLELQGALQGLEIQEHSRKRDKFRTALRTVWSEDKIEDLRKRVDGFRQELIMCMLVSFRDQLEYSSDRADENARGLGEAFLKHLERNKQWQQDWAEDCKRWQRDLICAIHQKGRSPDVTGLPVSGFVTTREKQLGQRLIDTLHFSEMMDRQERIAEAYTKTFQWIYDEPRARDKDWSNFAEWLESDSTLYWITGKAGSGKSTLMKYIYRHARTFEGLARWSPEKPPTTAAFFFWNSGSKIQMSQDGLLRSLLFQLVNERPALIPRILPKRWEVYQLFGDERLPWERPELRQAFKLLASEERSEEKYCFFIDGLDEFDQDHLQLIDFLKDLGSSSHVKMCVSSRPWVVFEDAFKHKPSLMLEHLTHTDIKLFVESKFRGNACFAELEMLEPQFASELLNAIVQKAAGVFLWVHLVVGSLLAGLVNGDRISDLQRRLDFLPPDLEDLYEKMMNSLDAFYFEHASQYFQIVRAALGPPTLLCLSFADEEPDYVHRCKVQALGTDERRLRMDLTRRRLNSRCKGLLEVSSEPTSVLTSENTTSKSNPVLEPTIQYLHRTVKDYLENPQVWTRIQAATKPDYSPYLALCRSAIIQFKVTEQDRLNPEFFRYAVAECLRYAHIVQEAFGDESIPDSWINLIDEIDNAASTLAQASDQLKSIQKLILSTSSDFQGSRVHSQWSWTRMLSSQRSSTGSIGSFLSLAVRLDLRCYVNERANKGALVVNDTGIWPLLADAVTLEDSVFSDLDWHLTVSTQMVKLLLHRGADPNWKLTPDTVWTRLLTNIRNRATDYESTLRPSTDQWLTWLAVYMDIVLLFLQNGADPSLDLHSLLGQATVRAPDSTWKLILSMVQKPWYARLLCT